MVLHGIIYFDTYNLKYPPQQIYPTKYLLNLLHRYAMPFQPSRWREEKTRRNWSVPAAKEGMSHLETSHNKNPNNQRWKYINPTFDPTTHNLANPRNNKPFICSMETLTRQNIFPVIVNVFSQPVLWLTSVVCRWKKSLQGLSITWRPFLTKRGMK